MATFAEIKETRLTIDDPPGFIDFLEVANFAVLPSSPVAQTAYRAVDTGTYYGHEGTAWEALKLRVSDSSLSAWIDDVGIDGAVQKSYRAIMAKLGSELLIVKNTDGAESTEFVKLTDLYNYYRNLAKDTASAPPDNNAGRFVHTRRPCIAGGNV